MVCRYFSSCCCVVVVVVVGCWLLCCVVVVVVVVAVVVVHPTPSPPPKVSSSDSTTSKKEHVCFPYSAVIKLLPGEITTFLIQQVIRTHWIGPKIGASLLCCTLNFFGKHVFLYSR